MSKQKLILNCTKKTIEELKEKYETIESLKLGDIHLGLFKIIYMFISPILDDSLKQMVMIDVEEIEGKDA